jgi:hypothetical protein
VVVAWKVLVVACSAKLSVEDAEPLGRHRGLRGRSSGPLRFHRAAIGEGVRRHRDSPHHLDPSSSQYAHLRRIEAAKFVIDIL